MARVTHQRMSRLPLPRLTGRRVITKAHALVWIFLPRSVHLMPPANARRVVTRARAQISVQLRTAQAAMITRSLPPLIAPPMRATHRPPADTPELLDHPRLPTDSWSRSVRSSLRRHPSSQADPSRRNSCRFPAAAPMSHPDRLLLHLSTAPTISCVFLAAVVATLPLTRETSQWRSRLALLLSLQRLTVPRSKLCKSSRSRLATSHSTDLVVSERVLKCRAH